MKGYIEMVNGKELDRSPCSKCIHQKKMTVEYPCYDCISVSDLASHKLNCETEFVYFEAVEGNAE